MNMSCRRRHFKTRHYQQHGFTLIELIVVLVILSIASVPLFGLYTQASMSLLDNEAIQTASQLAQERAELVLALKRSQGFAALATGTTNETLAGNFSGFTRNTVISQPATAPAGCPGSSTICKQVVVSVSQGGTVRSQISFLLVDY